MKKILTPLLGFVFSLGFSGLVSAAVVHVDHSEQLPPSGTAAYDLDGDGTNDIGLAEDCCRDETLWINGNGYATEFQYAFLNVGDVVDGSLAWVSGISGYTDFLVADSYHYVATRGTSIGDFFGYFAIFFDGTDTFLTDFWYEDSGKSITVAGVSEVPVPAAAFLFAPALLGFMGFRRKMNQKA